MAIKKIISYLPFWIGLCAGLYFFCFQLVGFQFTHFPGDLADARFNNYLLEHAHKFFTGQVSSFWDAPFMYPEKKVITYSDNLLGAAPFYSLLRFAGCDRENAFQWWFILMTVFNYTACYFFLKYLFKNNYSAALGAMVFAFSMALLSQVVHAQTFPRFAIPLSFWMLCLFLEDLNPKYFFFCILLLVYQIYCGIYLGFLLMVPLGIVIALSVLLKFKAYKNKFKETQWRWKMAGGICAAILVLLPIMLPYLRRAGDTGFYSYDYIKESLPSLISLFYSRHGTFFWEFLAELGVSYPAFWDHQLFPGGVAMICLIIFLVIVIIKKTATNRLSAFELTTNLWLLFLATVLTFLLFTRFGRFSFYTILYHIIPGYGSMRALQRIINIELLFFAVAVSFLFTVFLKKQNAISFIVFLILAFIIVLDNRSRPDFLDRWEMADSKKRVDYVLSKIKTHIPQKIISYEPDTLVTKSIYYQLDGMMASQSLGMRTLNGYSATAPEGYNAYWDKPNEKTRKIWLETTGLSNDSIQVIR
jgi:hypothetical protein